MNPASSSTTQRDALNTALFDDASKEHAETVIKPYFGPVFETYLELRKVLAANKDLLGIATNYVDPVTGSAEGTSFRTLSLSAPELVGIKLDVDAQGNVLMTHPGKDKNRNFTLDGHMGSVLTVGGLPLIPFDPISIDQSDRTSVFPLPNVKHQGRKRTTESPEKTSETSKPGSSEPAAPRTDKDC